MKNQLIPGIIMALILQTFVFVLCLFWTIPQIVEFPWWSYLIVTMVLLILAALSWLYYCRNYANFCRAWVEKTYNFFFINIGTQKINEKVFFILAFVLSGLLNIFALFMVFFQYAELVYSLNWEYLILDMLVINGVLFSVMFLAALTWVLIIRKNSNNFYQDVRFAMLLLPPYGFIYFLTLQPSKTILIR